MCSISSRTRCLSGSGYVTEKSRHADGRREAGGRANYGIIIKHSAARLQISTFLTAVLKRYVMKLSGID